MTTEQKRKLARTIGVLIGQGIAWIALRRAKAPGWAIFMELSAIGRAFNITEAISDLKESVREQPSA